MNYKEIKHNGKSYKKESVIIEILKKNGFYWLIDSELSNAVIEIKNDTLIWHDGIFLSGRWNYGIFKGGEFHGVWENGIFEDGLFQGEWVSGIR